LGTNIQCRRINNYLLITGFLKTSQFINIDVVFDVLSRNVAIVDPLFDIKTFFDSSLALNPGSPNENDFLRSLMKGPSLGTAKVLYFVFLSDFLIIKINQFINKKKLKILLKL
jgi:hypothetical protein